jgi:hypothetical protein
MGLVMVPPNRRCIDGNDESGLEEGVAPAGVADIAANFAMTNNRSILAD